MGTNKQTKIVIVGGKATGSKAGAILARRLPEAEITLYQKEHYHSYSSCGLPYFASGDIGSFEQLTVTPYGVSKGPEFYKNSKGFTVVPGALITEINRRDKSISGKLLEGNEDFEAPYDKLVLATGSLPNKPAFPVADSPRIRHFVMPEDAVHFRKLAEGGKIGKVVIIGGGYVGCEMTEAMVGMWGIEATIVEKENQLLPYALDFEMSRIVERELSRQGVNVLTGSVVKGIEVDDQGNPVVHIQNREEIAADYVFLCIGVSPNIGLAENCGLEIGETGAIRVNDRMQTSDGDIYAGGDCVESFNLVTKSSIYIPMGSLANRHARIIAENIAGKETVFPGVTGTFLIKIFDLNVGAVGISSGEARKHGMAAKEVWGTFVDKPDYYPEPKRFTLKMIYSGENNRLLGLQAVGMGDICRRVDVFSEFLRRGSRVEDLFYLEHGYAPPYSEPLDPLSEMAGIAGAQKRGVSFLNFAEEIDSEAFFLDTREESEAVGLPWPLPKEAPEGGYLNIPLNDVRNNLDKLDRGRKIVIICSRGARSYQAALMLKKAGFNDVHVLGGGTLAALS